MLSTLSFSHSRVFRGVFFSATLVILALTFGVFLARASSRDDISFPVAELGGCVSEEVCRAYCDDERNMEVCLSFAERHNLLEQEEAERARAMVRALAEGTSPGGCSSRRACEAFCEDPDHIEECLAFAEKEGLIDERELETVRKVLPLMRRGEMPGGCRGKQACETYCGDERHLDECITFAEKAGFMSREEVELVRKTGGRGPGGCRGKEACEAFCAAEENQEVCFSFGVEHGLVSEEDLRRMEEGRRSAQEAFNQMPPEVLSCVSERLGSEEVEGMRSGSRMPSRRSGEVIHTCFEQNAAAERTRYGEESDGGDGVRAYPEREGMTPRGDASRRGSIPPEIQSCLEQRGITLDALMGGASPDAGRVIEECMRALYEEKQMTPPPSAPAVPDESFDRAPLYRDLEGRLPLRSLVGQILLSARRFLRFPLSSSLFCQFCQRVDTPWWVRYTSIMRLMGESMVDDSQVPLSA